MKRALRVANVLSWINLLLWGVNIASALINSLTAFNPLMLVVFVLLASIPLHSYAALQLHKSIRRPEHKLSHQTPSGIRFVGLIAMLFGFIFFLCGIVLVKDAGSVLSSAKEFGFMQDLYSQLTVADIRRSGVVALVLGLIIIVNVILNLRLLRWYYLVHQSDAS